MTLHAKRPIRVAAIMSPEPVTVAAGSSLDTAMELMDEHDVRHLPVLGDDGLAGMISDRDLLEVTGWLHPAEREVLEAPKGRVRDFMAQPVVSVTEDSELEQALALMVEHRIGCLPVVSGPELVGVLSEMDVLRSYADACRTGRVSSKRDVPIGELLTPSPMTIGVECDGTEAARALREARVRHLPVVDGASLVGILSDRDVRLQRGQGRLELATVGEMMTPSPQTISVTSRLSSTALLMASEQISALPVMEADTLVGITTLVDVMTPCARVLRGAG